MSDFPAKTSVLPNRNTLGLCAVLAAMWYTGAGQTNGAAYLLCFTLASVAVVSVPHAWMNVRGVKLRAGPIAPVFAGDPISVPIFAEAAPGRRHLQVSAQIAGSAEIVPFGQISAAHSAQVALGAKAPLRGRYDGVKGRLTSSYPLGFFTGVMRFELRQTYYVYPRPEGHRPLPASFEPARETTSGLRADGDDFAGVREWQPGESMRHVDWKAAARGHRLLVKQWSGAVSELLLLDWKALPESPAEARLSQLARWALIAEQNGATYGLALPGFNLHPSRGEAHLHACLRALANFEPGEAGQSTGRISGESV